MKTALVLGSGACLEEDVEEYDGPVDGVVACNDAGAWWPGQLDAWVTLHPHFFYRAQSWATQREAKGYPKAKLMVAHEQPPAAFCPPLDLLTANKFPGMRNPGTSGMFAAKVALCDLGFNRVVLCGVPLDPRPHFFDDKPWTEAENYKQSWRDIPLEFRQRMRSMSGWTRELLGGPWGAPTW